MFMPSCSCLGSLYSRRRVAAATVLAVLVLPFATMAAEETSSDAVFLAAVRQYADNVLKYGRDVYGPKRTPLFVDGLNVDTHEPPVWVLPAEHAAIWKMPQRSVMCDLASQQNLFRVFDALTTITGEPKYRQAAVDAIRYGFEHLQYKDGLLFWGGHVFYDLDSDQPIGEGNKDWSVEKPIAATWDTGLVHELKCHYPHYDLMWKVNPAATRRAIEAAWACHILNWGTLEMNRHGVYGRHAGEPWNEEYVGGPVPFVSKGMPFMLCGSDLYFAAALLHGYTRDDAPLTWAKRLVARYDQLRNTKTGLAGDMYSIHKSHRLENQFGPEFGDRITDASIVNFQTPRFDRAAVVRLQLSERLGAAGQEFRDSAMKDLAAWAKQCYDPSDNGYWVMLADGTRLSEADVKRPGYATANGLRKHKAGSLHLWAYALAYRLTGDAECWNMARQIARGIGLGELGETPGAPGKLAIETTSADPISIFAILELHKAAPDAAYRSFIERIARNMLAQEFHKGFFVPSRDHLFAEFDSWAPLALLYAHCTLAGLDVALPLFSGGRSYFHCDYDGQGRTYDGSMIYGRKRTPT